MSLCQLNIVIKRQDGVFQLGYLEFSMNVKKNKPKKVTHVQWFPNREIKTLKQADLLLGKEIKNYQTLPKFFEYHNFKKPAISALIKLQRSVSCQPWKFWISISTSVIVGRAPELIS